MTLEDDGHLDVALLQRDLALVTVHRHRRWHTRGHYGHDHWGGGLGGVWRPWCCKRCEGMLHFMYTFMSFFGPPPHRGATWIPPALPHSIRTPRKPSRTAVLWLKGTRYVLQAAPQLTLEINPPRKSEHKGKKYYASSGKVNSLWSFLGKPRGEKTKISGVLEAMLKTKRIHLQEHLHTTIPLYNSTTNHSCDYAYQSIHSRESSLSFPRLLCLPTVCVDAFEKRHKASR